MTMRIATAQKKFIYDYWKENESSNQIYLFGSRVDDSKKGGDIDILVLSDKKLHHIDLFKMKQLFFSKFGQQKIDVISFTKSDESLFKKHVLSYAKLLNNE
jgi:predicted nucleotidyltransferase